MGKRLKEEGLNIDSLEDPGTRYSLGEVIGQGVNAIVYKATDSQEGGKSVAIKVQNLTDETTSFIQQEYKILRDLSEHPNFPDFYGIYKRDLENGTTQIWFVMQLCGGGPVTDLVRALIRQNKRMDEIHIAFILREVLKALTFLHENHVIHRDVKGGNVLLTKEGEVKLVDFALSGELDSTLDKRKTSLGTPSWMAPEVVTSKGDEDSYDNRADVWALGITAIELGDGKAPFQNMHPTRALFQIVRNPPPTLYRPAQWSQNYNDFIAECLIKNPEHRPYMVELLEHPFFSTIPSNDLHLEVELKSLVESIDDTDRAGRYKEITVQAGMVKEDQESKPKPLFVEDLAALEVATEDNILHHIESRYKQKMCFSFVGDVLLFLNPNYSLDIYGFKYNLKYKFKSRSDNEPHIYSVADSAFQNMLHHGQPQHIVLSGETKSGKTTMFRLLLKQLMFIGKVSNRTDDKILKAVDIIQAFGNAATPVNNDSTRHILFSQLTFSRNGKSSGAIFWLHQLEKWRVTGHRNPYHANFHIFYYFYYGMDAKGTLEHYNLEHDYDYCYLRRQIDDGDRDPKCPSGTREDKQRSIKQFDLICKYLLDLQLENEQIEIIWKTLAAILLLGEIDYKDDDDGNADIKNEDIADKVASLLSIEGKKLSWALCNYCVVENDTAARRKHSKAEALEARNVLAQTLYSRLVDWLINIINMKFSLSRTVFGDFNCINLLDLFGFECYEENGIEQLFVNSINEQLQYFYNQKVFISEMQEIEEEGLPPKRFNFFDNRTTMDELLNKPYGVIHLLDEANRLHQDSDFVISNLNKKPEGSHIQAINEEEFSVAHYTGKVTYNVLSMVSKNRDFLPPEITDVLRFSSDSVIKQMFTNKLSRTGNVTLMVDKTAPISAETGKKRWGSALLADSKRNIRRFNTASRGEFSQTRGIRTAAATFRAISLELLRSMTDGGVHFVRCIRTDLTGTPDGFQPNIVRQQLRALSVADTAREKLVGFSHRIPFEQFLERYRFLAFDYDENVDQTKANCRLLLVRLKMEGWYLGNSKVFLKYYNEEYLSRLYETQVKKIIKVQCMLRAFLAKRNVQQKKDPKQPTKSDIVTAGQINSPEEAAIIIQKHIKGYVARKRYGPLIHPASGKMNEETAIFIKPYAKKWKKKSMYQVLLKYKSRRHLDLVYFCQQVHLYNQNVVSSLQNCAKEKIDLKKLQKNVVADQFIGKELPAVWKIPFNIKDLPLCDSSLLSDSSDARFIRTDDIPWDDPFKSLDKGCQTTTEVDGIDFDKLKSRKSRFITFISEDFSRDPVKAEIKYGQQEFNDELDLIENEVEMGYVNDETNGPNEKEEELSDEEFGQNGVTRSESFKKINIPSTKSTPSKQIYNKSPRKYMATPKKEETTLLSPGKSPLGKQKLASPVKSPKKDIKTPLVERKKFIESTNDEDSGIIDFRRNLKPTKMGKKSNPILEMEMKGKESARSNSQNEDDPPFNFQAMLRKTGYQESPKRKIIENSELDNAFKRRSVKKRTNSTKENDEPNGIEYDNINNNNTIKTPTRTDLINNKNDSARKNKKSNDEIIPRNVEIINNNVAVNETTKQDKRKGFLRKDSFESIKLVLTATKDFPSQKPIVENGNLNEPEEDDLIRTELVPGLIIVGKITDL